MFKDLRNKILFKTMSKGNKIMTNIKKSTEIKNKFALGDDEVDNIFDILEKEHPDL